MWQALRLPVITVLLACAVHSYFHFFFISSSVDHKPSGLSALTGTSWYHPDAYIHPSGPSNTVNEDIPWIHRHLGGNGPWVEAHMFNAAAKRGIRSPLGCLVDQVHMLSRHTERFPTVKTGSRMLSLLARLQNSNIITTGDLAFIREWKFFSSDPGTEFGQLTRSGPYAGTLAAFATGVRMRTRYSNLIQHHFSSVNKVLHLWASDSARVVETAKHFAAGLLGLNWEEVAMLHVIPETADRGGNTLTPGDSCSRYLDDLEFGHEQGYHKLDAFTDTYLPNIAARLESFVQDQTSTVPFKLSNSEVYSMQEICGFEIMVRGSSPWCNIFSKEEWRHFAYARDVLHHYRAGPGTPYSAAMGGLYLNATAKLLHQGPDAGSLFLSFVHDGDIAPVLSALHIFDEDGLLPTTHVKTNRTWNTSHLMPMGARLIFERMSCPKDHLTDPANNFVRIIINDEVIALPGCQTGPGGSCPLPDFTARLRGHQSAAGDFRTICGLSEHVPDHIKFLHQ